MRNLDDVIHYEGNPAQPNLRTASFAAGYLEGALTAELIHFAISNYKPVTTVSPMVERFVTESNSFVQGSIQNVYGCILF